MECTVDKCYNQVAAAIEITVQGYKK